MHREIDRARDERLLDLLGEQPLAADVRERTILHRVAGGADDLDLDALGRDALRQPRPHHAGLRERKRTAARADPQGLHHLTSQCYAGRAGRTRAIIGGGGSKVAYDQGLAGWMGTRMIVLGIETTCDETAAAVVERAESGRGKILSNVVLSQVSEHAAFGGVVPEIAARAHVEALDLIIANAMTQAGRNFDAIDGVAAAAGPGLIGGVIVGLTTAKAIALVSEKPLIAVNHLEAHALTARLTDATPFPYCLFLASGGHTQIVAVRGIGQYERLGG